MAGQNAIQDENQVWTLIAASGTQNTASGTPPETRVITAETIGTFQGLHVVVLGTPIVSSSGGTDVNVFTGTQQTLGTVGTNIGVGTISSIGQVHNAGSIAALPDLPGGTLDAGTVVVTSLPDLPGGTIDLATVQINHIPVGSPVISTHVLGTGGGTVVGTIVAPTGAGTSLYLAGLSIVVHSGTVDCGIANNVAGTTGAGVYARGAFIPSAGIARDFTTPKNLGTNGTIAYFMISAGTVSFNVDYWVTP